MQQHENQEHIKNSFKDLSELYLFEELYKFFKESTGIAITIAYMAMILSSMAYLYILYDSFNIDIVKYVTLEDVLATPIKNPNFIFIFIGIFVVLFSADLGNRFRAKQQIKYANSEKPLRFKISQFVFWSPKNRAKNIKYTTVSVFACLMSFIFASASIQSENVKEGLGNNVEITLVKGDEVIETTLLGTSSNYVFTYDYTTKESVIYYLQSIKSIKALAATQETAEKEMPISESD